MLKQYHLLKGHNLNTINLSQIQISINKTTLGTVITDILASENNGALLKAITPHLANKFPQFPQFTNVSLDSIDENGAGNVTLKMPRATTATAKPVDEVSLDEVNLDDEVDTIDEVDMSAPSFGE